MGCGSASRCGIAASLSRKGAFIVQSARSTATLTYVSLAGTRRYYEWVKKGFQSIPYFTRHKDQRLMLFAGLYDSVTFEGALVTCYIPVRY